MFTEVVVADIDVLSAWAKFWKSCKFQCTRIVLKDLAVHIRFGANDWDVALLHFLDETHDWNNISKGHGHGNVLSLCGQKSNLGLKLSSPNDKTTCIEYGPSTSGLGRAGVDISKRLVPIPGEISITIALKTLLSVGLETNSNVSSLLQIAYQIKHGFSMRFPWVRRVLGELMSCIHDVGSGSLSEIIELADHRTIVEIEIEKGVHP